jgi:hypothetical protein
LFDIRYSLLLAEATMQRAVGPTLALYVSLGLVSVAGAQDEPRALIRRAIDARGGEARISRPGASHMTVQGVVHILDGASFTGEAWQQDPDRLRVGIEINLPDVNGGKRDVMHVRNGTRVWMRLNGSTQELNEQRLASFKRAEYVDRVTGLVDLLKDKAFTLAALGESQLDGRAVLGVKVTSKDHPDVSLFFDRATGHLVRMRYQAADDDADSKAVLHETAYDDYRPPDYAAADERILRTAKLDADGPALLQIFRQQTLSAADQKRMTQLVRQLGDKSFRTREKAVDALVAQGAAAVPLLRKAAADADAEVARRARDCLERIDASTSTRVVTSAARLVALRRPRGAAEVLLAYLPGAADEAVAGEVRAALAAIAIVDGKPNPALVEALTDRDPVRRAAAAAALGKDGGAAERQPGRRLYIDGVKVPMKIVHYRDGEKFMDWTVTDLQYFNKLDDGIFAKP